ncbi:unnamed protein product [Hermetia illucens]|uniref:Uncharacterized protein n=1 Tax=Hermetia illucens TaxID=343691 RepID=A0A7R8UZM5_HERIL|nr:uncharacterized protein LOC119658067 [Hermetia illucens]CAD7090100.1 unnamed protein product [Hermetia illucens]
MRRASFTPIFNVSNHEPLIVVEETNVGEDDDSKQSKKSNSGESSEAESPVNPYLLSPFPDLQQRRKHSLPSLQITEGITASQVRRLSEAGSEGSALSSKDVEFLATLSQKTIPASGGRRHSIVTISPVPTSLFGRNRRESISGPFSRRGSAVQGPPLTEHRGSVHNLQLDIMDGIVQARKNRSGSGVWSAGMTENNVQVET